MMTRYPLSKRCDYYFIEIEGRLWLLDTGAPLSFGDSDEITISDRSFPISGDYFGLNAEALGELIGLDCEGLLGMDVLGQFDVIFNLPEGHITVSSERLDCDSTPVQLSDVMGVPIVECTIADVRQRLFFDTGAKISYLVGGDSLVGSPSGDVIDFYPGFGEFTTSTQFVEIGLDGIHLEERVGSLPELIEMTLQMAGVDGILSGEVLSRGAVGLFVRRGVMCL